MPILENPKLPVLKYAIVYSTAPWLPDPEVVWVQGVTVDTLIAKLSNLKKVIPEFTIQRLPCKVFEYKNMETQ